MTQPGEQVARRILCVDDEANVVGGLKRSLGFDFDVHTASSGGEALDLIARAGPFATVISDMRMPGMDGAELLNRVKKLSPNTTRVLLTGYANVHSAIRAVNEGQIFSFLTKPCPPDLLRGTAETAVAQYNLIVTEKEHFQKILADGVRVLGQALEVIDPITFSRTSRIQEIVGHIAEQTDAPDRWQVEVAANLSQMCMALQEEVCGGSCEEKPPRSSQPESLPADRDGTPFTARPEAAAACLGLLRQIPRLENVVRMIEKHHQLADGATRSEDGDDSAWFAGRILHAAYEWDRIILEGYSEEEALAKLREMGPHFPAAFFEALSTLPSADTRMARHVDDDGLRVGMSLAEDLRSTSNALLMASGHRLNPLSLARLREFVRTGQIQGPFQIRIASERPEIGQD